MDASTVNFQTDNIRERLSKLDTAKSPGSHKPHTRLLQEQRTEIAYLLKLKYPLAPKNHRKVGFKQILL